MRTNPDTQGIHQTDIQACPPYSMPAIIQYRYREIPFLPDFRQGGDIYVRKSQKMFEYTLDKRTGVWYIDINPIEQTFCEVTDMYENSVRLFPIQRSIDQAQGVQTVNRAGRKYARRGGRPAHRSTVRFLHNRSTIILLGFLFLLMGTAVLILGQSSDTPDVEASTIQQKYYTSIDIESGDTLWSLAEEYGARYQDYDIFMDEVRKINHLDGDNITYGASLLIPVYR